MDSRPGTKPDVFADIMGLPFAAGSVERAYAGHVLEHIEFDALTEALEEIRRVLRPGAELLVVGPDVEKGRALFESGSYPATSVTAEERLKGLGVTHDHGGNPALHKWDCSETVVAKALMGVFGAVHIMPIADTPVEFPVWDRYTPDQFAILVKV